MTNLDQDPNTAESPLLSPAQRASEIVFGIIMALSITAAMSVGGASRGDARELLVAALACNVAWGFVDAAMYLINTLVDRARRRKVASDLREAATDEEFRAILLRNAQEDLVGKIQAEGIARLRRWVTRHGDDLPKGLDGSDWLAALQIWLLVFGATLPLVAPFLFVDDPVTGLRVSQVIAVAMLFGLGMGLGRWIGVNRWSSGLSFAAVGVAITGACIAMGG